jgi:hypothetical protein
LPAPFEPYPGVGKVKPKVLRPSRQPAIRVLLVLIAAFFLLRYEITKKPASRHDFELAAAIALAVLVYPFVDGPIRLHSQGGLPVQSGFRLATEDTGPPLQGDRDPQLRQLGFEYAGQIIKPAGGNNVAVRMHIYLHSQNQDSAQLTEILAGQGTTPHFGFKARFKDGIAFETNDTANAPIFEDDPNYRSFRFPQVRSTDSLYRLHRRIKEKLFADHFPTMADKEGELAEFIARFEVAQQRLAQCGDYQLSRESDDYQLSIEPDCYRFMWKGAIRQSWLLAWPVKHIRALLLQSRSLRMAKELGLPINAELACINESKGSPP